MTNSSRRQLCVSVCPSPSLPAIVPPFSLSRKQEEMLCRQSRVSASGGWHRPSAEDKWRFPGSGLRISSMSFQIIQQGQTGGWRVSWETYHGAFQTVAKGLASQRYDLTSQSMIQSLLLWSRGKSVPLLFMLLGIMAGSALHLRITGLPAPLRARGPGPASPVGSSDLAGKGVR